MRFIWRRGVKLFEMKIGDQRAKYSISKTCKCKLAKLIILFFVSCT